MLFLLLHRHLLPLFPEHLPAHLQHSLKAFATLLCVLPEALHARLLDLRLDLLPAAAQSHDLRFLHELCLPHWICCERLVDDCLATLEEVRPRHVRAAHSDFLRGRVHVGDLVHEGGGVTAEEGEHPLRCVLMAGNQALGAEDAGR